MNQTRTPARPRARARMGALLVALALLLLVGACTGTREEQSSTLLIVGVEQGGTPQLALVEDRQDGTPVGDRVRFLEASRRDLPAPAVALDFTGREHGREVAFVLTRSVAGSDVRAYLQRFDVSGVDPDAPTAFAQIGEPLVLAGPGGILPEDDTTNSLICPSEVQVSRTGRWVLVLDVPTECVSSSGDFPVVWLVDSVAGTASALEVSNSVLGAGIYTDQRADDERGYFLVEGPGSVQVFATDLESGRADWYGERLLQVDPPDLVAVAGSGSRLIALTSSRLVGVDLGLPAGQGALGPTPTPTTARDLVVDPLGRSDHVLVLASSQTLVHDGMEDEARDPDRVTVGAADAVIDPLRAYAYLLVQGGVVTLDLYTGGDSGDVLRSNRFDVPELTLPPGGPGGPAGVISWVRAADPLPRP